MYEIILYDTEDGRCPVQELLDSLEPKLLAKTLRTIDLLEMNGPLLREPYSKPLENGIFELRTKQGSDITRVLYFFIIGKRLSLSIERFPCLFAMINSSFSIIYQLIKMINLSILKVNRKLALFISEC